MNLFEYAWSNPVNLIDPFGFAAVPFGGPPVPVPNGGEGNGWKWNPNPQNPRGGSYGPIRPIPNQSQPSANWERKNPDRWSTMGHWDVKDGKGNTDRVDMNGNPITPEEAHGKEPNFTPDKFVPPIVIPPNFSVVGTILVPICAVMPFLPFCKNKEHPYFCPRAMNSNDSDVEYAYRKKTISWYTKFSEWVEFLFLERRLNAHSNFRGR